MAKLPVLKLGRPWREAAWAFLLSRFIIIFASLISLAVIPFAGAKEGVNCFQYVRTCLLTWNYWDVLAYSDIAHYGYRLAQNVVFFPLWPLAIRSLASLFGGTDANYFFSALVLANVFFYLALVLFFLLVRSLFDATVARRALFTLALYPYAVFFFVGYTEALFLLLSLTMFYCLQFHHLASWWVAGIFAALATLTRPTGLVLIIPYLLFFAQRFSLNPVDDVIYQSKPFPTRRLSPRRRSHSLSTSTKRFPPTDFVGVNGMNRLPNPVGERGRRQGMNRLPNPVGEICDWLALFAPVIMIPLALSCYMLYLDITWKNPFLFVAAERDGWGRYPAFPWLGLVQTVTALLTGYQFFHNLMDLSFTLLPLWLIVLSWRRMPIAYTCYAIGMALFSLSNPSVSSEPLTSAPRYMLTIFPCFLLLGLYCKHPLVWRIYLVISAVLLTIFTAFFVHHYWLA